MSKKSDKKVQPIESFENRISYLEQDIDIILDDFVSTKDSEELHKQMLNLKEKFDILKSEYIYIISRRKEYLNDMLRLNILEEFELDGEDILIDDILNELQKDYQALDVDFNIVCSNWNKVLVSKETAIKVIALNKRIISLYELIFE